MGTGPGKGKKGLHAKKKAYYRAVHKHWSINGRTKDLDQIHDQLPKKKVEVAEGKLAFDEDMPGMGQHYCPETDRYFVDANTLAKHKQTKFYKKALKKLKEDMYRHEEAEAGAGKTKEVLPSASALRAAHAQAEQAAAAQAGFAAAGMR